MMEWSLPPGRAGRAPQASRHSNSGELVLGAGGREVVADVAAGSGIEGGLGPVADAETDAIRALFEQALTNDAKPTLPASRSS